MRSKKDNLCVLAGIAAAALLAAGCGKGAATNTVSGGGVVSGTPVSGSAASEAAVSGTSVQEDDEVQKGERKLQAADITEQRYANDWGIFEGDRDKGIYQYDLRGKQVKYYDLDLAIGGEEMSFTVPEVLWVDNDGIFISCHRNQEYYEIWRIPADRKGKKNLLLEKKEKLVKVKRLYGLYTKTDREIIYGADEKICRLDLKSKKVKELDTGAQQYDFEIIRDANGIPFVQDETIFYNDSMEGLYRVDLAKWKIIPMGKICDGTMAAEGDSIYFRTEGLMKYDAGTGKKEVLIPFEELTEKLENTDAPREHAGKKKTGGEMFDDYNVKNIFLQEDRLYLAVEVSYEVGEEDEYDEGDFAEIMLSCRAEDGSDLRYEKSLTEYLWKHSVPYRDASGESLWEELTGSFCQQMDDCIVMYFYEEDKLDEKNYDWEDLHRYVMYDLRDGTFWNVKKPSDAYGYIKALGHSCYEEAHC